MLKADFVGSAAELVTTCKVFRIALEVRKIDIGIIQIALRRLNLGKQFLLGHVVTRSTFKEVATGNDNGGSGNDGKNIVYSFHLYHNLL